MSTLKVDNLNGSTGTTVNVPTGQILHVDKFQSDNIQITDDTISTYITNSDINITPNGNGRIVLDGLNFPTADGTADQVLKTDGSGNLSFTTISANAITEGNTNMTVADTGTGSITASVDGTTEMTITPNNVRIHGNLTVDGTNTIVNTTTLSIEDNIIEVNRNISSNAGMPSYSGIKVNRGATADATEQDLYWVWDETYADDGSSIYGNAGGAFTAFRSQDDNLSAPTLVDIRANILHGTATGAQYSDLAERYAADAAYAKGTIVKLGGAEEITVATGEESTDFFGVVSTQPAFMMNSGAGNNDSHPYVACVGRVPVRVKGTADKGDAIVLSDEDGVGKAIKRTVVSNTHAVIGRALADKTDAAIGTVECVVNISL